MSLRDDLNAADDARRVADDARVAEIARRVAREEIDRFWRGGSVDGQPESDEFGEFAKAAVNAMARTFVPMRQPDAAELAVMSAEHDRRLALQAAGENESLKEKPGLPGIAPDLTRWLVGLRAKTGSYASYTAADWATLAALRMLENAGLLSRTRNGMNVPERTSTEARTVLPEELRALFAHILIDSAKGIDDLQQRPGPQRNEFSELLHSILRPAISALLDHVVDELPARPKVRGNFDGLDPGDVFGVVHLGASPSLAGVDSPSVGVGRPAAGAVVGVPAAESNLYRSPMSETGRETGRDRLRGLVHALGYAIDQAQAVISQVSAPLPPAVVDCAPSTRDGGVEVSPRDSTAAVPGARPAVSSQQAAAAGHSVGGDL